MPHGGWYGAPIGGLDVGTGGWSCGATSSVEAPKLGRRWPTIGKDGEGRIAADVPEGGMAPDVGDEALSPPPIPRAASAASLPDSRTPARATAAHRYFKV
ncbi:MAG: hypothetical protein WDN31_15075, partial [Hyphomicrobium sp.]